MQKTYQIRKYKIRKYISLAAALAFSGCMLFGCTRADIASSSQGASGAGGNVGQSIVTGVTSDGTLAGGGAQQSAPDPSGSSSQASADTARTVQNAVGQTTQNLSGTAATPPAADQGAQSVPDEAQSQTIEDASAQAWAPDTGAGPATETFTGAFERSDGGERVQITLLNDNAISFQFTNSGIGATAQAYGSTAVYYGDDGYSISFDVAGDMLAVSVDGEDAKQSPMNGIYYRVLDTGDDGEAEDSSGTPDLYEESDEESEDFTDEEYIDADAEGAAVDVE